MLRRYQASVVLDSGYEHQSSAREEWLSALELEGATVIQAEQGQRLMLDGGDNDRGAEPATATAKGDVFRT